MPQASYGDTVRVLYEGRTDEMGVFDLTDDTDPFEFTLGKDAVIPGFEEAIVGMEPGETKRVTVPPEDAYGPRQDDLLAEAPRGTFPEDLDPAPGNVLEVEMEDGSREVVTVVQVGDDSVIVDRNHPLAGRELTFEITLLDVA